MALRLQINTATLRDALSLLHEAARNTEPALEEIGAHMRTIPRDAVEAGADPETGAPWPARGGLSLALRGSGKTLVNTARLLSSLNASNVAGSAVTIGTNLPYAAMHQYGGTQRPRNAKMLALPLTREAARAGSARRFFEQNKGKAFFLRSKKGNVFIARHTGKGKRAKLVLEYLLRDSVVIPRRPYLGWGSRSVERVGEIIIDHLSAGLAGGG